MYGLRYFLIFLFSYFQEPDKGLMLPWDRQNLDKADLLNSCFGTTGRNPMNLILIEFCTVGLSENEPL